jgi:GR25 family glycosyltransferase involved in LPS biosynthesis
MFKIKLKNVKKENEDYIFKNNSCLNIIALDDIFFQVNICVNDVIEIKINENIHIIKENILYSTKLLKNQVIEIKGSQVIMKLLNIYSKLLEIEHKINIDYIFIINLNKDIERKKKMKEIMKKNNIQKFEFFEAINGIEHKKEYVKIKSEGSQIKSIGHFGCLKSHLNAIKIAKLRNYKNILILEDDVYFDNLLEKINSITIPNTNILYFGGLNNSIKLFNCDYAYAYGIMGCYAYMIMNTYYDEIINLYETMTHCIDVMLYKTQPFNNFIILSDVIQTNIETSNTSNKSKKFLDYLAKTHKKINYIQNININNLKIKIITDLFNIDIDKLVKNKYCIYIKNLFFISNEVYENDVDKTFPWLYYKHTDIHTTLINVIENAKYVIHDSLYSYGIYSKYFKTDNFKLAKHDIKYLILSNTFKIGYLKDLEYSNTSYLIQNFKNYKGYIVEFIECLEPIDNILCYVCLPSYDIVYNKCLEYANLKVFCLNRGVFIQSLTSNFYKISSKLTNTELLEEFKSFLDSIIT